MLKLTHTWKVMSLRFMEPEGSQEPAIRPYPVPGGSSEFLSPAPSADTTLH
jgi:hypothetical protein